jgi:hypothetical protein
LITVEHSSGGNAALNPEEPVLRSCRRFLAAGIPDLNDEHEDIV